MKIHYLQHVPFEDLANIWMWASEKKHIITSTKLYMDEKLPEVNSFDWLIAMGGPMNIYEEEKYPWLAEEKEFIKEAIESRKFVLGICLGAQLVADVLGGKVKENSYKEIGWLPVKKISGGSDFLKSLPDEFTAFHWHGDTFDIPPAAERLAETKGCANQAFEYGENVLALQFHLESSQASIEHLIENCAEDMTEGMYVQTQDEILSAKGYLTQAKTHMESMLDSIEKKILAGPEKK